MTCRLNSRWTLLVIANVLFCCVLSFHRPTSAAPRQPFANSVEQRAQMITQLKEINALLKQQNTLLASGQLKVVLAGVKK